MTALSPVEIRLLSIVQENYMSNVELAERVGMAPSPCLRRMKALKDSGYIEKTVSILDRRKLGFEILAHVEVKVPQTADRSVDEEFRRAVANEPAIVGCYVIAGQFDFLLKVVANSIDAYSELSRNVLLRLPGVQDMRSSFVMEVVKDSTALPLNAVRR